MRDLHRVRPALPASPTHLPRGDSTLSAPETCIALHLGSSFIKGALLDLADLCLTQIRRVPFPEPISGLPPLLHEVEPVRIVTAVVDLLGQLLALAPGCRGLVFCSQMHGLVLTTPDGQPRSNFISWQDQRSRQPHPSGQARYFDLLARQVGPMEQRQLGNELQPSRPMS